MSNFCSIVRVTFLSLDELEAIMDVENWQLEERRKINPRKEGVRTAAANELWECGYLKKVRKIE